MMILFYLTVVNSAKMCSQQNFVRLIVWTIHENLNHYGSIIYIRPFFYWFPENWLFKSYFYVKKYLLLFKTVPMSASMLNYEFWARSYGYLNKCIFRDAIPVHGFFHLIAELALRSVMDLLFRFIGLLYFIRCRSVQIKNPTGSFSKPFSVFKNNFQELAIFLQPSNACDHGLWPSAGCKALILCFGLQRFSFHLTSFPPNAEVTNCRIIASSKLWDLEDLPSSSSISSKCRISNFQSLINTHTPKGCYVSKEGSGHVAKLKGDIWSN